MKSEAKLTFEFLNKNDTEFENREASKIEFTVPDDMNIWEYKIMCIRLASAIGYTANSIESAFGDGYERDRDNIENILNAFKLNLDDSVIPRSGKDKNEYRN